MTYARQLNNAFHEKYASKSAIEKAEIMNCSVQTVNSIKDSDKTCGILVNWAIKNNVRGLVRLAKLAAKEKKEKIKALKSKMSKVKKGKGPGWKKKQIPDLVIITWKPPRPDEPFSLGKPSWVTSGELRGDV